MQLQNILIRVGVRPIRAGELLVQLVVLVKQRQEHIAWRMKGFLHFEEDLLQEGHRGTETVDADMPDGAFFTDLKLTERANANLPACVSTAVAGAQEAPSLREVFPLGD